MFNVPLEEQETIINFMRSDDHATIYTSDRTTITRLDKLCEHEPGNYKIIKQDTINGEVCGKTYRVSDKSLVSFRARKKVSNLTDEQKQAAGERLRNIRKRV